MNICCFPCGNLLCRINDNGYCDAEYLVNVLCSSQDFYDQCKERTTGQDLIKSIERFLGVKFIKNNKGEVGYAS